MLYRIIYLSSAIHLPSDADIDTILAVSRRNNRRDDITGLLICHDGSFFQVLEGPRQAVETCYDRICRDPRHNSQINLWHGDVAARVFAEWQMGFARFDDLAGGVPGLRRLGDLARGGDGEIPDRVVTLLMTSFLRSFRDLPTARAG